MHVLIWSPAGRTGEVDRDAGCPVSHPWRVLRYIERLKKLGIQMRGLPVAPTNPLITRMPGETTGLVVDDQTRAAVQEATDWADVILWRSPQECEWECRHCGTMTGSEAVARRHALQTGHEPFPDDIALRRLWGGVRRDRVGVLYDVDRRDEPDDLWWIPAGLRDQVQGWAYPVATADLVTASTPRLARYLERFNPNVRVVRNSVDVAAFTPTQPRPEGEAVRLVWYAPGERLPDWTGPAQAAAQEHRDLLRTVSIGADPGNVAQWSTLHAAGFDEVRRACGFRDWPTHLSNAWPEIGAVPLRPHPFNACRSEAGHWGEFAALGCPVVAERWRGPIGPYAAIREGIDGLLARGRREWTTQVGRLAASAQLRAQIGGAARERVLAEYRVADRAQELADALRWAAERPGIGRSVA